MNTNLLLGQKSQHPTRCGVLCVKKKRQNLHKHYTHTSTSRVQRKLAIIPFVVLFYFLKGLWHILIAHTVGPFTCISANRSQQPYRTITRTQEGKKHKKNKWKKMRKNFLSARLPNIRTDKNEQRIMP